MTVKLIDVANMAGVSKSTVSQYLNGRYKYMSEATRIKIEKVIKELNYQPNIIARSLKIKKTNTIGVIVSNIRSPFFAQALRGIEKLCLEKNYNVILCNTDNDSKKELEYLTMLKNKQVDGIVISYSGNNIDFMKDFIKTKIPVVVFDKDVYGLDVSTVVSENRNGAYKAINHFYNEGFRDIGIVSSDLKGIPCRIERIRGYKEALTNNKIQIDEDKIFFFNEDLDFIPQMEKVFSKRKMPRAVFTFNYQVTMEFLRFCKKAILKSQRMLLLLDLMIFLMLNSLMFLSLLLPRKTII